MGCACRAPEAVAEDRFDEPDLGRAGAAGHAMGPPKAVMWREDWG